jgi:glutathione S-transferase
MTLVLHEHPFAAYCWKALVALYELDLPFERALVEGEAGRARLAGLWPPASIPVLVDGELTLPESTTIVEYLDGLAEGGPRLVGPDPLQARLWDRVVDGHVMTPMQQIVADSLRDEGDHDPAGVRDAYAHLEQSYELLAAHLADRAWLAGPEFTLADCAAAPALFYARVVHRWDEERLSALTRYFAALIARPSVARVIDEAREYRRLFPLPWPDYADEPSAV